MSELGNTPSADAPTTARPRRWLYVTPLIVFAALAVLFLFRLFAGDASRVPSALVGKPAPLLTLAPLEGLRLNGQPVPGLTPADLTAGKVTVLNVFASWCGPCRVEHPHLIAMARSEAVRSGRVQIAGLNYKDEAENARRFLGALGNPYTLVGVDRNGRNAIEWGVYGVPETFLIGPTGVILHKHIGPLDQIAAQRMIDRALEAIGSRP